MGSRPQIPEPLLSILFESEHCVFMPFQQKICVECCDECCAVTPEMRADYFHSKHNKKGLFVNMLFLLFSVSEFYKTMYLINKSYVLNKTISLQVRLVVEVVWPLFLFFILVWVRGANKPVYKGQCKYKHIY